jgi:prepilin-type N-terminal cleavage/methylation domain-containing protein
VAAVIEQSNSKGIDSSGLLAVGAVGGEVVAAFSLAEVLITLTVIGVVASIAIPDLVAYYQNLQYKTQLKKVYAEMSQATQLIKNDNGGTLKGLWPDSNTWHGGTGINGMGLLYSKYLNTAKICTSNTTTGLCWHADNKWFDSNNNPKATCSGCITLYTRTNFWIYGSAQVGIFPNCDGIGGESCVGPVYIDINGEAKPNKEYSDIYLFTITADRLKPYGSTAAALE